MRNIEETFFIVPGFKQKITDAPIMWLRKFLQDMGFRVVGVPVKWNYHTMTDYAKDYEQFYEWKKSETNYVLGFSYGSVITLITANRLKPKKIYLCSLSPDFKEDLKYMKPPEIKLIGIKRIEDIKLRSARQFASELEVPSVVFYGEAEGKKYPELKIRCEETVNLAKNSSLIIVKKAPHKLDHPEYIKALKKELTRLAQT